MTRIHNPPHPGETLREDVLPALPRVLNGRAAVSPEMSLRLEGRLGVENGGRAGLWISQQAADDLWQARQAGMPKVRRAVLATA